MKEINGYDALRKMEAISKTGGCFTLSFYRYSRRRQEASSSLETRGGCVCRTPMPTDKLSIDGWNFFLFTASGENRMCYKYLIRYVGFPEDNYQLQKIKWL